MEKIYKAYLIQKGEGCDYMIGCAQTVIDIEASTLQEAIEKLKEEIKEDYADDSALFSAKLYEISHIYEIDIDKLYEELDSERQGIVKKSKEEDERAELLRLSKKYNQ